MARQFGSVFVGERLSISSPQGRFAAGARRIDGQTLVGSRAHGKQLFLTFDNDLELRVHLGLYGAWSFGGDDTFRGASSIGAPRRVGEQETSDDGEELTYAGPPTPVGAVRVRLVASHGWADLRGPTACEVLTSGESAMIESKLGPDPLDPHADPEAFTARVRRSRTPIAALLMNQSVIAGVGNVYRAEVLFRRRLNPQTPGRELSTTDVQALWSEAVAAMLNGVRNGRIVTTDPLIWGGGVATPEEAHYVYRRAGKQCRVCNAKVLVSELAARKLYWCPDCQS
nr:DNA-formamidopyrimidine glycosylase family protein [Arthrobacter roseus]